jgi:hypothetical protein
MYCIHLLGSLNVDVLCLSKMSPDFYMFYTMYYSIIIKEKPTNAQLVCILS